MRRLMAAVIAAALTLPVMLTMGVVRVHASATTWYVGNTSDWPASVCVPTTSDPPSAADAAANILCTLRQAISGAAAGDTVLLPNAGPYQLADANGALTIDDAHAVTIKGPNGNATVEPATPATFNNRILRVNTVHANSFALVHVTLANGDGAGLNGGALASDNTGLVTLTDVALRDSKSRIVDTQGGFGGCLYVAQGATVHATNLTVTGCTADVAGGGIANDGSLTVTGATVNDNRSLDKNYQNPSDRCGLGGGAIFNDAPITLTDVTLNGNHATNDGGAIYNAPAGSSTTFQSIRATNNLADGQLLLADGGGGVYDAPDGFTDCFNVSSEAVRPAARAAVAAQSSSSWTDIVLSGNVATHMSGGGLYERNVSTNVSTWNRVEVSNNSAAREGGGIYASNQSSSFTNVTLNGNQAPHGGGIGVGEVKSSGTVTLLHITDSGNTATSEPTGAVATGDPVDGGGLAVDVSDHVRVTNSIISANQVRTSAGDCAIEEAAVYTDGGGNLVGPDCPHTVSSDIVTEDPQLQPLANNGYAFSRTMALTASSPEVDTALSGPCAATDQRLVTRPQLSGCDMGAFEFVAAPVPPTTGPPPPPTPSTPDTGAGAAAGGPLLILAGFAALLAARRRGMRA